MIVAITPHAASMLSSRLNALVITTIHTTVMTVSMGSPNRLALAPAAHRDRRRRDLDQEPDPGRTVRMSSTSPEIATSRAAAKIAAACAFHPGEREASTATAPSAMATPPRYGVGAVCAFPARGMVGDALRQRQAPRERHEERHDDERHATSECDSPTVEHCCLPSAGGDACPLRRVNWSNEVASPPEARDPTEDLPRIP